MSNLHALTHAFVQFYCCTVPGWRKSREIWAESVAATPSDDFRSNIRRIYSQRIFRFFRLSAHFSAVFRRGRLSDFPHAWLIPEYGQMQDGGSRYWPHKDVSKAKDR